MKVSVVLTTYNGEKYLKAQLDSIANQSYPADEVIILDDCSTDNTVSLVKKYILAHGLNNWILIVNDHNMGWKRNFKNGFDHATGDLIFPADQDDIWHKDKIKIMTSYMVNDNKINLLASNYQVLYEGSNNKSHSSQIAKMKQYEPGKVYMIDFEHDWVCPRRPGCTYCFKKSFYEKIKNEWDTSEAHDVQLWCYASLYDSLALCGDYLIEFRRHGDNATAKDGLSLKSRADASRIYISRIEKYKKYLINNGLMTDLKKERILQQLNFEKTRLNFMISRKLRLFFVLFFKYGRFYYTRRNMLGDLYYVIKSR